MKITRRDSDYGNNEEKAMRQDILRVEISSVTKVEAWYHILDLSLSYNSGGENIGFNGFSLSLYSRFRDRSIVRIEKTKTKMSIRKITYVLGCGRLYYRMGGISQSE